MTKHLYYFILVLLLASCTTERRRLEMIQPGKPLPTGWYHMSTQPNEFGRMHVSKPGVLQYVHPRPFILADDIEDMTYTDNADGHEMVIILGDEGRKAFSDATSGSKGKSIAFIVDDEIWTIVAVQGQVTNGELHMLDFTKDQYHYISSKIKLTKK